MISVREQTEELSQSFVQALGERWKPTEVLAALPRTPLDFCALVDFVETHLAREQEPRGLAEAAAELYDIYIGDVIKKGPVKRKHFTIWWEYVLVVRPHFLQFYNGRGKKVSRGSFPAVPRVFDSVENVHSTEMAPVGNNGFFLTIGQRIPVDFAVSDRESTEFRPIESYESSCVELQFWLVEQLQLDTAPGSQILRHHQ